MTNSFQLDDESLQEQGSLRQAAEAVLSGGVCFRALLDTFPAAVYLTDHNGCLAYYNKAAVALWGCRPELGKSEWCSSWKLLSPDGAPLPHDECPMAIALKESRPIRGLEVIAERADGGRVPFLAYTTPLYDATGGLAGAVNMLVDITARIRAEKDALRLASIVEFSDDAIVSKDLNGTITSWNRGAQQLFGYGAEEAIGKSVTILVPLDRQDEEQEFLSRIRRGEHIDHYETVRKRKDGSMVEISLTVSPVKNATGRIVGASKIARDITERKRSQEQRDLLLAEMKHRVKNTLSTVLAIAAQTMRGASSEEHSAFSERLQALARTHDVLTQESWDRAPLRDVVDNALHPFQERHRDRVLCKGPDVVLNAKTSLLVTMALHELATNAAKYGALSNGSGQVSLTWLLPQDDPHRVRLCWQESGGPPVTPPAHKGFGSALVERALNEELGSPRFEFDPQGLVCKLEVML